MPGFWVTPYLAPKRGSEARECEDSLSFNKNRGRFCIADGATESFASRYWARLLVKHWTQTKYPFETRREVAAWAASLGDHFDQRWRRRQLSWFAEEKARSGAYAAFVGLWFFEQSAHLHWRAIAIGDACLVLWRQEAIVTSFPLHDPKSFGFRPILLPSNRGVQSTTLERIEERSGDALPGDVIFLLTDAIAAWFLHAAKHTPEQILEFQAMLKRGIRNDLDEFIERERSNGTLRNDDVGVLRIQVAS